MKQTCILVLGMHRSGTSALTGVLNLLDVYLGSKLLNPQEDNIKGFFENQHLVEINKKILLSLHSSWDDVFLNSYTLLSNVSNELKDELKQCICQEFRDKPIFAIKDPRISILYPLYKEIFTELGIIINIILPFRNPMEIANSLHKRNAFSIEKGMLLWSYYFLLSEKYTRDEKRIFVDFGELLNSPQQVIEMIEKSFLLGFEKKYEEKREEIERYLEKGLKHNNTAYSDLPEDMPTIVKKILNYKDELNTKKYYSDFDLYVQELFDYKKLFYHNEIREFSYTLLKFQNSLEEKELAIQERNQVIQNKNEKISQQAEVIIRKNELISQQEQVILTKNEQIKEQLNLLGNQEKELQEYKKRMQQLKQTLYLKDLEIQKYRDLAEFMRIKNRLKRLLFIDNESLLMKVIHNSQENGIKHTLKKVKGKIFQESMRIEKKSNNSDVKKVVLMSPFDSMQSIRISLKDNYLGNLTSKPLVSIIVLTKDGLHHIKRLFKAISENTLYENFEIIVVDNNSNDDTLIFLEENIYKFDLRIIKNEKNETFSFANNQAADIAKGEYLLLLNNDIEPLKGWLTHLVEALQKSVKSGAVGAQLIYPYDEQEPFSLMVQHAGIAFSSEVIEELQLKFFRPYNLSIGKIPIITNEKLEIMQKIAVTAACLLVKKEIYFEVGGLDEAYNYGYEDVDFCLKLHQAGYENYYCQNSILFHYESSTQKRETQKNIKGRRVHNIKVLHSKWHRYVEKNFFYEKLKTKTGVFAEKKLKIAFAVTEAGKNAVAGDYFTALELAESFKEMGYEILYLTRKNGDWYDIPKDVNIFVSMLDAYDLTKIKDKSNNIIKIAWIRNWVDRWLNNKFFLEYDLLFASSQTLCDLVFEKSGKEAILFPIATNPEKFQRDKYKHDNYVCDYCFTGNYWGVPREIETFLNPKDIQYKFSIYGKDWDQVEKFKKYHQGFLQYTDIPKVYANSKITIDDAVVGITKPYGSVNSRVFDAIAGGTLVITNGVIGAKETFGDLLPVYETEEELNSFLQEYLSDDTKRNKKIKALQEFVFKHHTYRIRAQQMKQKIEEMMGIEKSVVIKMPIPTWKEAKTWGDYHLGLGLKREFEKLGYDCLLQVLSEWENQEGDVCDIVIVLRGLSQYKPKSHQINFMWNISHPDKISLEEYNAYDTVFVSSDKWAEYLQEVLSTNVAVMHQCTDPNIFRPDKDEKYRHQLLFVGNSRNIFRKSLQYLLPTQYELAVFGTLWQKFIDKKYIKAEHIENAKLYKYYSNADIVLNDHWDSMRDNGFISNRIFDVLACNGFILTDNVYGLDKMFDNLLVTYNSETDLKEKVRYYIENREEAKKIAQKGRTLVLAKHTYANRVEQIIKNLGNK